jgi:hypothetical protein
MMQVDPRFRLPFVLQCALASGVFYVFFLAQSSAYLLYLNPRSEWLWFLSVKLNREAKPILDLFDAALPLTPLASCAVLAGLCVVPLVFCIGRSWLGISVLGHVALVVALFPVAIAMQDAGKAASYASLANIAELVVRNTITGFWLMAACMLLPLCVLNHVAFFRNVQRQAS